MKLTPDATLPGLSRCSLSNFPQPQPRGAGGASHLKTRPRASHIFPIRFSCASAPHSHNVSSKTGSRGQIRSADERPRDPFVRGVSVWTTDVLAGPVFAVAPTCELDDVQHPGALPAGCRATSPLDATAVIVLRCCPMSPLSTTAAVA